MRTLLADPIQMIQMGAPHLIESDEELETYTRALFALTAKDEPTAEEIDAINLLSMLVERYEAERFPLPDVSDVAMLRYLMELKDVNQQALIGLLGSQALVSMILSGDRKLTVAHITALSAFFRVSPAVFFPAQR